MSLAKKLAIACVLSLVAWISVAVVVAHSVRIDPDDFFRFHSRHLGSRYVAGQSVRVDGGQEFFRIGGRNVVRLWQDFVLRQNELARDVVVISGSTAIAGEVDGDVVAILGPVRLESTAKINGSLIVIGGNANIADGATVRRDLVVIAGAATVPVSFYPGGEYIAIGDAWMAAQLHAIVPWVTRGLLWGRIVVPSLGWIWWLVFISLILTLAANLVLHGVVGECADKIAERPAGTFLTGMLVLLLTAPICVLLAATVIGLAIVPFVLCAVVVAWITGKVGVTRWIGRSILGHEAMETRLQAMGAVVVGFAGIILLYMVPVVGLVTWALVSVFGLGSAFLSIMSAVRRERPPSAPKVTKDKTGEAPLETSGAPPASAMAFQAADIPLHASEAPVHSAAVPPYGPDSVPPIESPPFDAAQGRPPYSPYSPSLAGTGAAVMPHATFIDRLIATALDVAFVVVVFNVFFSRFWFRHNDDALMVLLFAYFVVFWAWKGTTLGGIVCNMRIVRVDGRPLTGSDAIIRGLASLFSLVPLGIGFFWILRDPQQQAWHDKIAGTFVVKVPKDYPL